MGLLDEGNDVWISKNDDPKRKLKYTLEIIKDLCIGCGNCEAVCPPAANAISYEHNSKELMKLLPRCIESGAESIELHAGVPDDESTLKEWDIVSKSVPNGMISMCLDRKHLSNKMLLDRIVLAHEIAGERLIIQADGIPMSGGIDDFNTTLQAVSIADFLNKELKDLDREKIKISRDSSKAKNKILESRQKLERSKINLIEIINNKNWARIIFLA